MYIIYFHHLNPFYSMEVNDLILFPSFLLILVFEYFYRISQSQTFNPVNMVLFLEEIWTFHSFRRNIKITVMSTYICFL